MLIFSYSLRNLLARRLTTVFTIGGLALVVFVFVAALMLAHGLETTLTATGLPDNVLILRKGSNTEIASGIYREQAGILKTQPQIAQNSFGQPLMAAELVVLITLHKFDRNSPANVVTRGTVPEALLLRPQIRLRHGRAWQPGTTEIIVGGQIARRFQHIGVEKHLQFARREWTIVGVFDADGSGFESEILGDVEQLMAAYGRDSFSSVTMRLANPASFEAIKARLENDPRLSLQVKREVDYYTEKSGSLSIFIQLLALVLTSVFAVGAVLGAAMTMHGSVSNRTAEIGTLRALGFARRHILAAILLESLFIGGAAGVVGLAGASALQSVTISTMNWSTFSELAFGFALSPTIAFSGLLFSLIMGGLGGLLPAIHAVRLPVVVALASRGV